MTDENIYMVNLPAEMRPIKIYEYKHDAADEERREILLMPNKDDGQWQYINMTKGYICPCKFPTREDALKDFAKYVKKFRRVEFEEL